MRIISPFKDYYDVGQSLGTDPSLVFKREQTWHRVQTTVENKLAQEIRRPELVRSGGFGKLGKLCQLLFCGRVYWYFWYEKESSPNDGYPVPDRQLFEHLQHRSNTFFYNERQRYGQGRKLDSVIEAAVLKLEEELQAHRDIPVGHWLHQHFRAPMLLIIPGETRGERWVQTNPRLADFEFQRLIDPLTAWQEIQMYLGNELAEPDIAPQTVGDDRVLAASKGFDDQSFRTQAPGQKKLARKLNRARKKNHESPL